MLARHIKTISLLSILCTLAAAVALLAIHQIEVSASHALARQTAQTFSQAIHQARISYSQNTVNKIRNIEGVSVGHDHKAISGRIPNPATFAIELGETISDVDAGVLIRLYSDYPFASRKDTGGPKDEYERAALAALAKNPRQPYIKEAMYNGISTLRYSDAVVMQQSCVDCHNSHPDSPKHDWQVGDVRGALQITQPLMTGNDLEATIRYGYLAFIVLASIGMVCLAVTIIRLRKVYGELDQTIQKRTQHLQQLAETDSLTGIANRRCFDAYLESQWQLHNRLQQPLSLIMYDLDHFKAINDQYGHSVGDQCLKTVSEQVSFLLRQGNGDLHARYGGEEFVALLPNIRHSDAMMIAERIRSVVAALAIGPVNLQLRISLGVATLTPSDDNVADDLLQLADRAMYQAKAKGRDRVCD